MRHRLLVLAWLFVLAGPVWAAPVQTKESIVDNAATADIAFDSNVTNGNLINLCITRYTGSTTDAAVAGDVTKQAGTATIGTVTINSTQQNTTDTSNKVTVALARIPITGTGSLTLRVAGNSGEYYFLSGSEWANLTATPEGSNGGVGTSTSPDSGTVASAGKALFVGCVGHPGSETTITPDGAFTQLDEEEGSGGAHVAGAAEYREVSSGTTDSASWTLGASNNWAAVVSVYTDNTAGGAAETFGFRRRRTQ